jgi:hypothetical protein
MLANPIAILLLRPLRLFFVAVALIVGYATTMGVALEADEAPACDASDVSRVELLR